MRDAKWVAVIALLALGWIGGPAAAEEAEAPAAAAEVSSCLPQLLRAPAASPRTEDGCYNMTWCPNDDYCWSVCSTAAAAACINNVCQFTLPGGGTGPGSGGNSCPEQRHCFDASHCIYSGGIFGSCSGGVCVC